MLELIRFVVLVLNLFGDAECLRLEFHCEEPRCVVCCIKGWYVRKLLARYGPVLTNVSFGSGKNVWDHELCS